MVSKYGKDFQVPKDFPSVLKAFTREVLRDQPENIYEFGANYFSTLLEQLQASEHDDAQPGRLTPQEMEALLKRLFHEADTDGSGALSIEEFRNVMNQADMGISKSEMRRLMAEADVNDDGEIDYTEFVPLAVDLIQGKNAKRALEEEKAAMEQEERMKAEKFLIHGMDEEDLQKLMKDVFKKADADGNGSLSLQEFKSCIEEAELGLTRVEINMLMQNVDRDGDGKVSYEEFMPLCLEILVEIMKEELLNAKRPDELEQYLCSLFQSNDADGSGYLVLENLRDCLRSADLGLTRLQIHAVLAAADTDEESHRVDYASFASVAAQMIYKLKNESAIRDREAAISRLGEGDLIHGETPEEVKRILLEACKKKDSMNARVLPRNDLNDVLAGCSLGLSKKEVTCLLSAIDVDQNGYVAYEPLIDYAPKQLQYLARNAHTF